jgi:hypothetical protein
MFKIDKIMKWLFNLLFTEKTRDFLAKYGYEWLKTLSGKDSFFSSKRIERVLFITAYTSMTCLWVYHRRNEMSSGEFVLVVSPLMVYAGFNTTQIRKDKLDDKPDGDGDNANTKTVTKTEDGK